MRCPECGCKECCGAGMSVEIDKLTEGVKRLESENARFRDCIAALLPFLMEDYEGGIMTAKYKAAIEGAIEAIKTEARNAS